MKKYILLLLAATVFLFSGVTAGAAVSVPEKVRVGIYFGSSALSSVTVSADGGVYISCDGVDLGWLAAATFTQSGNYWTVSGGAEPVTVAGSKVTITPSGGLLTINKKTYRGQIELVPNGSNITVVNYLGIEEYLYGVVPLEMSTGWPMEALKTQAVCARTYVAKSIGKYQSQGFDVYNTTMSQVYGGASVEKADCTQAVNETKGIVITYGGALIDAVYSSASSNFHTFNVKDVWGGSLPYLVGVEDSYQSLAKPDGHAWTATFTPQQLKEALAKKSVDIGDITDLRIDARSDEGAVTALTFVGTNGEYTAKIGNTRTILNLRSQGYTISKDVSGGAGAMTVLGSSGKVTMTMASASGASGVLGIASKVIGADGVISDILGGGTVLSYTLSGSGYGHGLGMSQYGANGMAKAGFTYDQIIKHYYTGVELTQ